jgi:GrpB-like predicted nucleotidyltransferase (UPF0157 family)
MDYPIEIVPYNRQWPEIFEKERQALLSVIGDKAVFIEHIGSTFVPRLGAKPIIDIMVGVQQLVDKDDYIQAIKELGYIYVPEYEETIPDRWFFYKGKPNLHTHHLNVVEFEKDFWRRHLLFRDYLRSHPYMAKKYYQLKNDLARRCGSNREAYTELKTAFVKSIEGLAIKEFNKNIATGEEDDFA